MIIHLREFLKGVKVMLAEIFISILIMSTVGSMLILLLLALKPLTERIFGANWQFYIWLSVLFVLICPLKIETELEMPQTVLQSINDVTEKRTGEISVFEDYSGVYMSQTVQGNTLNWFSVIAAIWLGVAAVLIIKTVISNIALKNSLHRESRYCCDFGKAEMRISEKVAAPILFGGLKPVLYIPQGIYDTSKMQYIAAHEGVHIRRNDINIKWFVALVKGIHWFNPLVYYLVRQIDEACEISCDVEAVKIMNGEQKREYMQTILDISQMEINFKGSLSVGLSSGGRCLKRRFAAIKKIKKGSGTMRVLGIAAAIVLTFCSVCTCGVISGSAKQGVQPAELILVAPKEDLSVEENDIYSDTETAIAEEVVTKNNVLAEEPDLAATKKPKNEATKRPAIVGEFNSEGGDTRIINGVKPDENGCIRLAISSNAQEVIDIFVNDGESGREVHSFSIPVSQDASYVIDGLDKEKTYDIVLRGTMRNNWKIESKYILY